MGESDVSVANIRNIGVIIMWQRISAVMTRLLLHTVAVRHGQFNAEEDLCRAQEGSFRFLILLI